MICILALVVFGILGIFSAAHRQTAKEAFDCVFKTITLRPCDTGLDQRLRGKIVGWLFRRSPKMAGAVSHHFKIFSWLLVIIFFGSMIYSGIAIYNLAVHGTCDPENPETCILTQEQVDAGCTCEEEGLSGCSLLETGEVCGDDCNCVDKIDCPT